MKLVITGPESSGKTTLAKAFAQQKNALYVEEYARQYLQQLQRPYNFEDVLAIAKGQLKLEEQAQQRSNGLIVLDTGLLVCKIWQAYKYGNVSPWIEAAFEQRPYQLYVLCSVDIPWEYDPLREHPEQRSELFDLYHQALLVSGKQFCIVNGSVEQRIAQIEKALTN